MGYARREPPAVELVELGKRLSSPPSSVDELYSLLDKLDGQLSSVEQLPSRSMLEALQPLMKAITMKDLLGHSDIDVKVAVASCITEITRITAPEAPYAGDILKEIFQKIVAAFEGLDDISSRSFKKRVSILETVAKVRLGVLMLDLECDALILQMFHHFLKAIRANHPESVLSSMETIMSLVIEESDNLSADLLSPFLDTLKNNNKDALPISQKLAVRVIKNCATKIKPYLLELVQCKGFPLSEYNKFVVSICQADHNETHASGEILADDNKMSERTISDELPQVSARMRHEVGFPEKVGTAEDISPVEAKSNGSVQLGNGDSIEEPSSPKQMSEHNGQFQSAASSQAGHDNLEMVAAKPDGVTDFKKAKGCKTIKSVQSTDAIGDSRSGRDKDASMVTNRRKSCTKEGDSSKVDKASAKEIEPAVCEKKNEERTYIASITSVENPPNCALNKGRQPSGSKASANSTDLDALAKPPASPSAQKDHSESNETYSEAIKENDTDKQPDDVDGEGPANLTSDPEVKRRKSIGKKGQFKREAAEREPSGRKQKSYKKQEDEENTLGSKIKQEMEEDASGNYIDGNQTLKIFETPGRKNELHEQLVGSKIKVWWPADEMFYDGTVDSYDPVTKKHEILYADGDIEFLFLKDERWEYIENDTEKDVPGKQRAEWYGSQMLLSIKAGTGIFQEIIDQDEVYKYYADGEWRKSTSRRSVSIINPTTRKAEYKVQACTQEEVEKVMAAAKKAQKAWAKTLLCKRAELLHKAAGLLNDSKGHIAECLVKEIAKPKRDAENEIVRCGDLVSYIAKEGVRILIDGKFRVSDIFAGNEHDKYCLSSKIPLGVVLAIPPFDYPVYMAVSKIATALIAGNALVIKPPTQGVVAVLHMVHCFHLAGFPKGLISCITGEKSEIGDFLTMHPGVNCISFTGVDTGIAISKKTGTVRLHMELGEKVACIVLEDADLDLVADNIIKGGFSYSGRSCAAIKVVLVMESMANALIEKVNANVAKLTVGPPENDCDITHLMSESSANFIEVLVMDAKEKGATFCQEYKREGNLIWPLLLDNVQTDMRIAWEEPFGPVLPVIRINSVEEGIHHCNASNFRLQACIFTRDMNKAMLISDLMEMDTVEINSAPAWGSDHFPFQDLKDSGIGSQSITNNITMMTKIKSTIINFPS